MDEMDTVHREFISLYNSVDVQSDISFKNALIKLLNHTKMHFASEERLMNEFNYPRSAEHKDEHNKVLSEMNYFVEISRSVFGMKMLKSYYLQKIPEWFDLHLLSMDSDLAHFLKGNQKRQMN